jgi:hypothetical protein
LNTWLSQEAAAAVVFTTEAVAEQVALEQLQAIQLLEAHLTQ